MSRDEWYRRSTWTTEDEQEFRARLKRARSFSRPQYLRLQAIHLEQAGLLDEAIQLLEEVVREYAEDGQIAWVHDHLGSCHEKAGRIDEAIQELRLSIAAQERHPYVTSKAWLELGRISVEYGVPELFDEFLKLLEKHSQGQGGLAAEIHFPAERYLLSAVLALIYKARGDLARAREYAKVAVAAADLRHSGFRRHPTIGLVTDTTGGLFKSISVLAATG